MQILYIITQADGGGAQKYVLTLARYFKGVIAAGDEARKLFDDAKAAGIEVYPLRHLKRNINLWHDFLAMWEIRRLVKTLNPDIVHLNSTKAGILGSIACAFLKVSVSHGRENMKPKIVFTAHGFRFLEPLPFVAQTFYLALEKVASSYRDFIITVSDADKKSALENKIISENKIKTVHNGLGQINFLPRGEARRALGLPEDENIYGIIANDYETKGLDILPKLELPKNTTLAVIGKVAANRKSEGQVKYLGYRDGASKYLLAFDAVIIPSKKEGFPYVALEAMQAGRSIIASNVGGIPEAVGDAGILVEPNDPKALSTAIKQLAGDAQLKQSLEEKALQRSKIFTEEEMLKHTEKIYHYLKPQG